MKRVLLFVISSLFLGLSSINAQYVEWAEHAVSGPSMSYAGDTDAAGNTYITGHYYSGITLGSITHSNAGFYLAKYDASGQVIWSTVGVGDPDSRGVDIALDAAGNAFVTGWFRQGVTLGTGANQVTLNNTNTASPFYQEMFIAKFAANGDLLWAKSGGGSLDDVGAKLVLDTNGDCYVAGEFEGVVTYDGNPLVGPEIDFAHTFLFKCDGATGAMEWVTELYGRLNNSYTGDMSTDGTDLYVIFGNNDSFQKVSGANGAVIFDMDTETSETLGVLGTDPSGNSYVMSHSTDVNTREGLIHFAKYNNSGGLLWKKSFSGEYNIPPRGRAIAIDGNNVYLTGRFHTNLDLAGEFTLKGVPNPYISLEKAFVAKYDVNGNLDWARASAGTSTDYSNDISVDGQGHVYITGTVEGNPTFECAGFSSPRDPFLVKYIDGTHPTNPATIAGSLKPDPAGAITGPIAISYGQTGVVYSIAPIANAITYAWQVPTGASITAGIGTTSITVDFGTATSGDITVEGVGISCSGDASSIMVSAPLQLAGNVRTEDGLNIKDVVFTLASSNQTNQTAADGNYAFANLQSQNYTVTATKADDHKNGMNVLDLAALQRHVLNIAPLNSPYKMIAADVDQSGTLTSADVIKMQRIALGFEAPPATLWYFIPASFSFLDPTNPWSTAYPQSKSYEPLDNVLLNEDFIGIRLGDLNLDRNTQ